MAAPEPRDRDRRPRPRGCLRRRRRQGAPEAVQVADRWHLLRNLGEAVRAVVDRHHAEARRAARQVTQNLAVAAQVAAMAVEKEPTAAERRLRDAYARRQARHEEAARLREAGVSLRRRIAGLLGAERKTVRRWLRAGHAPLWTKPPRGRVLDPYRDHLERRWAEGCRNAAQLWRELVGRGFGGRPSVVRAWAGRRRQTEPDRARRLIPGAGPSWRPLSGHRVARLLMTAAELRPATDRIFIERLLGDVPEPARAITAATRLRRVLRREDDENLEDALAAAEGTMLASFATGLRQDLRAVQAALELPWTTSPVEGQISRLKMLKRTMYGRASFPLLRQRILYAA
jgi:transposase